MPWLELNMYAVSIVAIISTVNMYDSYFFSYLQKSYKHTDLYAIKLFKHKLHFYVSIFIVKIIVWKKYWFSIFWHANSAQKRQDLHQANRDVNIFLYLWKFKISFPNTCIASGTDMTWRLWQSRSHSLSQYIDNSIKISQVF